ncbi:MAG: methylated-DNA--[protein]-cysteine S-methyltransferase [Coxiellaceae bacterium]|nr:methylated-DNA--[protein]-cysteine S-methyltransferase [Coxiellaceae bacterium]
MKATRGIKDLPSDAVYSQMPSPVSQLTIVCSAKGLHAILWDADGKHSTSQHILQQIKRDDDYALIKKTKKQLTGYFQQKRKSFDLPLVLNGTSFQNSAWQQLSKIPYGETISYGEQAKRMGDKNKARAVGMANGRNPIPIIVPCHRVIGGNGKLVGFGGGMDNKALLLNLEKCQLFK